MAAVGHAVAYYLEFVTLILTSTALAPLSVAESCGNSAKDSKSSMTLAASFAGPPAFPHAIWAPLGAHIHAQGKVSLRPWKGHGTAVCL